MQRIKGTTSRLLVVFYGVKKFFTFSELRAFCHFPGSAVADRLLKDNSTDL